MRKEKEKPSYDLSLAKQLIEKGDYFIAGRAESFLANHYGRPRVFLQEIFRSMRPEDFSLSVELRNRPGTFADEYYPTYDGIKWYVKFFIGDDGSPCVEVWSCNWDGCVH